MVGSRATEPTDVRSQAIAAATRLFAERGFDGTPLQAVADEVGVTKQAVLHHFPTKDALRDAVLGAILGHWQEALPRLLLAATATEDRYDALYGELHRFFAESPDRARLLVRETMDRPAEITRLLRGPVRPWIAAVAGYIRDGQARGRHWSDADAEAYVVGVLFMVIAATAAAPVCQAAIAGDDGPARWEREQGRIAKAALFVPPPAAPTSPTSPARPTASTRSPARAPARKRPRR